MGDTRQKSGKGKAKERAATVSQLNRFLKVLLSDRALRNRLARGRAEIIAGEALGIELSKRQAAIFNRHFQDIVKFRRTLDELVRGGKVSGALLGNLP